MFIDTHCHLTDNYVSGDLAAVIARAATAGVKKMICPTADPTDIENAVKIATTHDNIWTTIGIHPEYHGTDAAHFLTRDIMTNPRVVGVGEIGLDYHECGGDTRDEQIKLFTTQLDIAREYNMPVAIHTRDAERDTMDILCGNVRGVMHCFTSSWDMARVMLDRGFYFSASGILTFKNAAEIRETFVKIPTDRLVIETDSPYCAPVPYRGKQCEPFMVVETARVLAEIHGLTLEQIAPILEQNTYALYPKMNAQ